MKVHVNMELKDPTQQLPIPPGVRRPEDLPVTLPLHMRNEPDPEVPGKEDPPPPATPWIRRYISGFSWVRGWDQDRDPTRGDDPLWWEWDYKEYGENSEGFSAPVDRRWTYFHRNEVRVGGEVRVELHLSAFADQDKSVLVFAKGQLYEGTSESTDDLDGEDKQYFRIPAGSENAIRMSIRTEENARDMASILAEVENVRDA